MKIYQSSFKSHHLIVCVVFSLVSFVGFCQNNQADVSTSITEQIKRCQSIEDDQPKQAISLAQKLLKQLDSKEYAIYYGQAMGCLGWSYAVTDQVAEAREVAYNLELLADDLLASAESVNLLRRSGSIFHRIGDRISAAENYQAAMSDAQELDFTAEKIPLLVNLGVLNAELREHDKAIENYYMALDLMQQTNDFKYHAPVLFNLAVTLNGSERYEESIKAYHQAEQLVNENWPKQRIAQVYYGLGVSYSGRSQFQQAKQYLEQTIALIEPENQETIFAYGAQVILAWVKVQLGDSEGALALADQAANFYDNPEIEASLVSADNPLNTLAQLYEALDQPQKALQYYKASRVIDQKFQDSFNKAYMAQIQAKLSDSKQRAELALLKNENSLNQLALDRTVHQRTLMVLALSFLLLVVLGIWIWQQHAKRQLVKLSTRDPLTGLLNRRGVVYWHQQNVFHEDTRLLWLVDLDQFKKINDDLGHEAGDQTLMAIGRSLKQLLNPQRCIGRWSGEEYIIITEDVSRSQINEFGDEILQKVNETHIEIGLNQIKVTASIGVSLIKGESTHMWNRALSQADKALYVAKDRGKNGMSIATDF